MPPVKRVGSLDIAEDLGFQKQEWVFERAGWALMGLVILLALLGLFGDGPISRVTQISPHGLSITYERFERRMSPAGMRIELPAQAVQGGQVRWWINSDYLDRVQVDEMFPAPLEVEESAGQVIFTIPAGDAGGPVRIRLTLNAQTAGRLSGEIGWVGGGSLSFSQFVYP